jgi:putative nucleotidyltransferase with HDIG domain
MFRILIRLKRLIRKILKVKAITRQSPSAGVRSRIEKFVMLIMAATLIAFLYPGDNLFYPLDFPRKGEIVFDDIIAPFQITVAKTPEELKEEKKAARDAVPVMIEYDRRTVDSVLSRFDKFTFAVDSSLKLIRQRQRAGSRSQTYGDSMMAISIAEISAAYPFVDSTVVARLFRAGNIAGFRNIIGEILKKEIYASGVLQNIIDLPGPKTRPVIIKIDDRDVFILRDKLLDLSRAYVNYLAALNNRSINDSINVDIYYDLGRHFIIPNLSINIKEIGAQQTVAMGEVSVVSEIVMAGEVIARAGSRISERQEKVLEAMYRQTEAQARTQSWYEPFLPLVARLILILGGFLLLYLYIYNFHKEIYLSNPKLLALFLVYGLELTLVFLIGNKLGLSVYLYPFAIFSILVTILFDAEIGTFNTFILALLLGILQRFDFSLALITIIVGTVACYSTQRLRHRSELFRSMAFLSVTYFIMIYFIETFRVAPASETFSLMGYGLINSVISPLLAIGILPIFESLFGFTTDITLLELSDLNRPLLKKLSMSAPGTYHHSIIVGSLAEAAAKAIGANSLLARVGAYYHDIGKMEIPDYFVENQLGIKSKHEGLTPSMSAIILASHVKKGRKLGEESDLPDEILNFVEEHHGTMTMSYFYNKAKEMGEEEPSVDDYRYPGPRPRTKETAIVMLADTVEAASRTLDEPKPARLRNLVHNTIYDRIQSGELYECPLTLSDLAVIEESFTQILTGVFHFRVEYPKKEEDEYEN